MMRADVKRLNEADSINLDRCYAESDRQRGMTRRSQALLAAAGESGPAMRWFVIRVATNSEKAVEESLGTVGIECWRPMEKRTRRAPHAKRQVVYKAPVFPGYLFVKVLNQDATWSGIMSVDGVISVLGGRIGPVPVPETNLLIFKKKLGEKSTDMEVVEAAFPIGAEVLIEDGPFASFTGTIESVLDERVATVLVEIFGRFTPVELSLAQITKRD
ncbi:putative transcription termination factor [Mesorhizobium plurifarium]|uniref:Transcription termination/antitermination protein NusG n=1 Tax=Mesorhizobium plurifarium TaxID=69974 RepID=A0A0K2VMQ6_MESPL|nr:putative transcription termination factor [Mesorhizobium plurifarium]